MDHWLQYVVVLDESIHSHHARGESIGMAAEVAHGSCTDLPPVRSRAQVNKSAKTLMGDFLTK
jgi:hypothetical protein